MLHDFIPIVHNLLVRDHPNGITIIPLSDAHYGSQEFNEVRWHKAVQRIYEDPHCFTVLVGDLLDNGLRNSKTNVFEQTCSPRAQKQWLLEELRCIAPKILAACGGNHERRTIVEADSDPLYDVMLALGRDDVYRQNIAFSHVRFCRDDKKYKHRSEFTLAVTHGNGGGQYVGSSANRVERFSNSLEGVDLLVTGHTHKPVTFPVSKLVFNPNANTIHQRQFTVVVASSFLDFGGYPVQKLMTPAATTTTEIRLIYSQDGRKEIRVIQ